jgi:hypothetical protein
MLLYFYFTMFHVKQAAILILTGGQQRLFLYASKQYLLSCFYKKFAYPTSMLFIELGR